MQFTVDGKNYDSLAMRTLSVSKEDVLMVLLAESGEVFVVTRHRKGMNVHRADAD